MGTLLRIGMPLQPGGDPWPPGGGSAFDPLGLGTGGVPAPLYFDSGTISPTASQAYDTDNGMYDVLVEGATKQWKRIFVIAGTYTVTPANADSTFTRARFYGPLRLIANTADSRGTLLLSAAIWNASGAQAVGSINIAAGFKLARTTQSPDLWPTRQGVIRVGSEWIGIGSGSLRRYNASWTLQATNSNALTGLLGTPDHLGGGFYADGKAWIAACYFDTCAAVNHSNQLACYDPTTLALLSTRTLEGFGIPDASGATLDADNRTLYVSSYCDPTKLWRFNFDTLQALGILSLDGGFVYYQGVQFRAGLVWVAALRAGTTASNVLAAFNPSTGKLVREYLLTEINSGALEIESFDFIDDNTVVVQYNDLSGPTSYAATYSLPTVASISTKGGWVGNKDSFWRLVGVGGSQLSAAFTAHGELVPASLYDFNEIYDNTGDDNSFEAWIPANASLRQNVKTGIGAAIYTGPLTVSATLKYGLSYNNSSTSRKIFANGSQRTASNASGGATWGVDAVFGWGGINRLNTSFHGTHRYACLFAAELSEADHQAIDADPSILFTPTNALTTAQKNAISPGSA